MAKMYTDKKTFVLFLASIFTMHQCMAGPILDRIQRDITSNWVLQSTTPQPCRIMYGDNVPLRYWARGGVTIPWGGPRGEEIWNCYSYSRRSNNNDVAYAFTTRGTAKEQFLHANRQTRNVVFTNNSIRVEQNIPETIFVHKLNSKLGQKQLILSAAENEQCYLQMIPGKIGKAVEKGCEDTPDGISHFKLCFSEHGRC